jgi:hypothetical protein
MQQKKIGLVPISAKPYHAGHHSLVTTASVENDEVILFVSISDRTRKDEFPILGKDMVRIWEEELEKIMPSNVRIEYGGSPVRKIYQIIEDACSENSNETFVVYSDPQDTAQNYPASAREKYMEPMCSLGKVIFAAEETPEKFTRGKGTPDVSGGKLRHYLESNNFEKFAYYMPPGVNAQNIFNILRSHLKENLMRDFIFAVLK